MKTIGTVTMAAMLIMAMLLMLSGCAAQPISSADRLTTPVQTEKAAVSDTSAGESIPEADDNELEDTMRLLIGKTEVPVTWEENASVEALRALCPVTIQMSMYGGFEQVGPIGQSIVRNDEQTSTDYGDIVLYSGNQIVIFYGSNSWAYTRLGHVDLPQKEMSELLRNRDVTIKLEKVMAN